VRHLRAPDATEWRNGNQLFLGITSDSNWGINCGQLVGDILQHRVDHRGPGRLTLPSERCHVLLLALVKACRVVEDRGTW
jgi:hypothetical protein